MATPITEKSIVDASSSFDEAARAFNTAPKDAKLDYQKFLGLANKKFGLSSTSTTNTSGGSTGSTDIIGGIGKVQDFSGKLSMGSSTDIMGVSTMLEGVKGSLTDLFSKQGGIIDGSISLLKKMGGKILDGGLDIAEKEKELRAQINSQLGVAGELSKNYREEIVKSLPGVVAMGYGFENVSNLMVGLAEQTGRFTTLNSEVVSETAKTSRAFVGDLDEMAKVFSTFEQVGIGAENTLEAINEAGKKSIGLGLNGKKTVDEIRQNISKLNEYGFQNGIKGLTSMIQKSTEFRMNMQDVFNIAEKVMSPDGAIELAANLSVLGGAMGDFGDPLKMMYDATNNVEGLQDALIGAAGSLATYNQEQGRFEVTGVNLRRAREMASSLGMSLGDLQKSAIAAAERSSAAVDLMSSGLVLDDEKTRFITNLARMKDGKMVIDVSSISKEFGGAQQIALDQLTNEQVKILEKNQDALKSMSVEDIARDQFTATQNLVLQVNEIGAMLKVQFAAAKGITVDKMDVYIKEVSNFLNEAKRGDKSNPATPMMDAIRKGDIGAVLKGSSYAKKQTPITVDNKPKKETTKETTTTEEISKQVEKGVIAGINATKYGTKQNITVQADLQPENPESYLSYQIGGR